MLRARTGLKLPHTQKRAMYLVASSGVRLPALTQSVIFRAKVVEIMPCPHIVLSRIVSPSGNFSVMPRKPTSGLDELTLRCRRRTEETS